MQTGKNKKQEDLLVVSTHAVVVKRETNHLFEIGSIVEIVDREDDGEGCVVLMCKSSTGLTSRLTPDELVPVYSNRMYEEGSLVVITDIGFGGHPFELGEVLTVVGINDYSMFCINKKGLKWPVSPAECRRVRYGYQDEHPPVFPEFREYRRYSKGSVVIVTSNEYGHSFKIGEIVTVMGNDDTLPYGMECANEEGQRWTVTMEECMLASDINAVPNFENVLSDVRMVNEKDHKTTPLKFVKLMEEMGELANQYLIHDGHIHYKDVSKEELTGEMADALQVLLSIYCDIEKKFGISIANDVLPMLKKKNKKWESKINGRL